jgi:hypothetical protein
MIVAHEVPGSGAKDASVSSLPRELDHDFPEMGATLHVAEGFSSFRERKNLIHYRMNAILGQSPIHFLKHFPAPDINSVHVQTLRHDRKDSGARFFSGQNADQTDVPAESARANRLGKCTCTSYLNDVVDTVSTR